MDGQRSVDHGAWAKGREGGQERGGDGCGWDTPSPSQATAPPSLGAGPVRTSGLASLAPPQGPPMSSDAPPLGPPPTARIPPPPIGQSGTQAPSIPAYLARNMTGVASSATLRSRPTPNIFVPRPLTTAAQPLPSLSLFSDLLDSSSTSSPSLAPQMETDPPRTHSPKELQALLEMGPKETARYECYVARASRGSNASPPPVLHTTAHRTHSPPMASPPPTAQQPVIYVEEVQPHGMTPSMPLAPPPTTAQLTKTLPPPPTMAQLQRPLPPPPTSAQLQAQQRMASPPPSLPYVTQVLPQAETTPLTATTTG